MKRRNDKYKNHLLKSYETVMDFAFRKMVYATSVYSAIEKGKIKPEYVGPQKIVMIDIRKYGNYKFRVHNPDKTALIKWYVSVGFKIKGEKLKRRLMAKYGLKRDDLTLQEPAKNAKSEGYKTLNGFTEWCYNSFVQHNRKGAFSNADIFYETLKKHFLWNLRDKRFVKQRLKAKQLLQRILKAIKEGSVAKLTYTGAEWRKNKDR